MSAPSHIAARLQTPGSPTHAALLRVALGFHLLGVFGSPGLDLLITIGPELHPQAGVVGGAALFERLSPALVAHLRDLGTLTAALLIVGLGGRITASLLLVSLLVTQYFWFGGSLFHDDWIYFVFPTLTFCCLTAPTAFSLDGLLRRRRRDLAAQARQARFVVEAWVFWIGFVYVAAGIAKLFPLAKGIEWLSGRAAQAFAVEFVRESPAVALFGAPLFPYDALWVFCLGAIGTVAVELGAAALWWTRRAYLPLAVAIFALHAGIWMVGIPAFIGMFGILALALLPAGGFARADTWRAARLSAPD